MERARSDDAGAEARQRLERLQRFTAALSAAVTTTDVLTVLAQDAGATARAQGSWVMLEDDSGKRLRAVAASGYAADAVASWPALEVGASLGSPEVYRSGRPKWFRSLEAYRARYPDADVPADASEGSIAIVPMVVRGSTIGTFVVQFADPGELPRETQAFIEALAIQAAQAIDRARLFDSEASARAEAEVERLRTARLQRATSALARAASSREAADAALTAAMDAIHADAGGVLMPDADGVLRFMCSVGGPFREMPEQPPLPPDGSTATGHAFLNGKPLWVDEEAWRTRFPRGYELFAGAGKGLFAVPLRTAGETFGVLILIFADRTEPSVEDREVATALGRQAALALRRTITSDLEHEVASTLQRAMLSTSFPESQGVVIASRYRPATEFLDVGGDWFDALHREDGSIALVIGDVVGRGLPAATTMGQLRTAWRALSVHGLGPSEVLQDLDLFARSLRGAGCTTVASALVDPERAAMRYACAGHLPPLLVSADRATRFLGEARLPPLAIADPPDAKEGFETLAPDDTLIFYTDGLVERRGEPIERGLEKLAHAASISLDLDVDSMCEGIMSGLTGDLDLSDDVALLVARVWPEFRSSTAARAETLADLRMQARTWLENHLSVEEAFDVVLAYSEAASNVVEHAYVAGAQAEENIDTRLRVGADRVTVSVADRGRWRDHPIDPLRGHGLKVMRSLMDDVAIKTSRSGTMVTMMKRRGHPTHDGRTWQGSGSGVRE